MPMQAGVWKNIELIEQPLAKDDWEGMKVLFEKSPIPLEHSVDKCHSHFHGINIKLTKCSGLTPALRMVQKAKGLSMKIMMGCMNESTVGSAVIAHCLPQLDYVDMDGPLLLSEDIACRLTYEHGVVTVSNKPGLGIHLK